MRTYNVSITGVQPLLMHRDNFEWADAMDAWQKDPKNKKEGKAGDDRTPAHRWIGYIYHDVARAIIPTDNIMRTIMEGATGINVKGNKTFKAQSQSGIMPMDVGWPLLVNGSEIPFKPIEDLIKVDSFSEHCDAVRGMGFSLFVKRAKVGTSKHIRVRPRFDTWATHGRLVVTDKQITTEILQTILDIAGREKGLGDWRPGSPKSPGVFGMFEAKVEIA